MIRPDARGSWRWFQTAKLSGAPGQIVAREPVGWRAPRPWRFPVAVPTPAALPEMRMLLCDPILLQPSRDRDDHVIVAALAQGFALFLAHPDDGVLSPSMRISLADRVEPGIRFSRMSLPMTATLRGISACHRFVDHAPGDDVEVENRRHLGRHATDPGVAAGLVVVPDVAARC